ncbi:hypothetical protein E2C01_037871 [Portunus trituberculatus]|uniref:Uncharacterized protein n=1 Tax=Portunus trituberculatus TaxID=210409 RepID=A0A5B7FF79_PORTR|nr:hypothetical protein [Portunus trituberculatus]
MSSMSARRACETSAKMGRDIWRLKRNLLCGAQAVSHAADTAHHGGALTPRQSHELLKGSIWPDYLSFNACFRTNKLGIGIEKGSHRRGLRFLDVL